MTASPPPAAPTRERGVVRVLVVTLVATLALVSCGGADAPLETSTGTAPSATGEVHNGSAVTTTAPSTAPIASSTTTSAAPSTTGSPVPVAPIETTIATPSPTDAPVATEAPTVAPAPAAPPLPAGPTSLYVLGDSVLLGTTYGMPPPMVAALVGWEVTLDCVGSRRLTQGLAVLQAERSRIGRVAVIQLGNNYIPGEGGTFAEQIDQAMTILAGTDRVVWVTVGEALSGRAELNAEIRAAATRHPTIVVADWAALVAANPGLAPGDGLHLSNEGRLALSALVADAVGPAPA